MGNLLELSPSYLIQPIDGSIPIKCNDKKLINSKNIFFFYI